ncbi:hypothetical protein [Candidatus Nephthysia bennettiae]|uniref:Uncharacterized protein n=1 Tax=Candidatus Nephthysia bennettiae TaxID=3127016 RepID=A0A934K7F5_9BACT|nr:hypothetical protein [Candidatus Dormibacteraeota bacterium]
MASDNSSSMVEAGAGLRIRNRELALSDPELIYDELVSHAGECGTCWPWRNQLWAVHRLCPTGAGLADRYAVAEARMGERE